MAIELLNDNMPLDLVLGDLCGLLEDFQKSGDHEAVAYLLWGLEIVLNHYKKLYLCNGKV